MVTIVFRYFKMHQNEYNLALFRFSGFWKALTQMEGHFTKIIFYSEDVVAKALNSEKRQVSFRSEYYASRTWLF